MKASDTDSCPTCDADNYPEHAPGCPEAHGPTYLRIEGRDSGFLREALCRFDAAGWPCTPPLPTKGLGTHSIVVTLAGPHERDRALAVLPRYLRRLFVVSFL